MRCLVVNSRQSKQPTGTQPWVINTVAAVRDCAAANYEIIASLGTPFWELVLWAGVQCNAKLHVICPCPTKQTELLLPGDRMAPVTEAIKQYTIEQFSLRPERVTWHFVAHTPSRPKSSWNERDRLAYHLATHVVPVSLRAESQWNARMVEAPKPLINDYRVRYEPRCPKPQWEKRQPSNIAQLWPPGSLVHLTRSCHGPWPGETRARYYQDVVASSEDYPRNALATVCRIIEQRCILGSTFRAIASKPRVCFTQNSADKVVQLVRYRRRYARYCFEPYGIAIMPDAAVRIAKPVFYTQTSRRRSKSAEAELSWLRQGAGTNMHWASENEWRAPNHVNLGNFRTDELLVIVATEHEQRQVQPCCPYRVVSLGYQSR